MKKIVLSIICAGMLISSCSEDFLNQYPKGRWHSENLPESNLDTEILVEGKLQEAYGKFREWGSVWPALAMNSYITEDANKGSSPADGGPFVLAFESMSYDPSNALITDFYNICYSTIYAVNEALNLLSGMDDSNPKKSVYVAEAKTIRAFVYYRLTQAFGGVPYIDRVMNKDEKTPARMDVNEVRNKYLAELEAAIQYLPTRKELLNSGNSGRATQNAARAIMAKTYMYMKDWGKAKVYTEQIINSQDNDLSTPFDKIFDEEYEYGPESVLEIYCEEKPDQKIGMGSQYAEVQGFRGSPDLGWGFNGPDKALREAFEEGDPRYQATVITPGETLEGMEMKANSGDFGYANKKAYAKKAEFEKYGRYLLLHGKWKNIRVIRYSDILLMHAEVCCELGGEQNINEALDKLEMVRNRARGGNMSVLPKVTTTDQNELRKAIHHERRIELALEFERFYDLVRWGEAEKAIPNFVKGKHELFPIPQQEIDKSEGVLIQNPGYEG